MERKKVVVKVRSGRENSVKSLLECRIKRLRLEDLIFSISKYEYCSGYLIVDMYDCDDVNIVFRDIKDCYGFLLGEGDNGNFIKLNL